MGLIRILKDSEGNRYTTLQYNVGYYPKGNGLSNTDLVFDEDTKVVYYQYLQYSTGFYSTKTPVVGYMSPYISENGKFCRFIDNKIVEIG